MSVIWFEKYRPTTIDEYVGSDQLKDRIRSFITNKEIPHLLLHSLSPGTGKTTLAKIIARSITEDVKYINASDENGIDTVRDKIKKYAQVSSFSGQKIIILDEFDFTTREHQAALRNIMEEYSSTTKFILTCNYIEKIIDPIQSRCVDIHVQPMNKSQCATRMVTILTAEGVNYTNNDVATIVSTYYPDMRRMINELQRQSVLVKNQLTLVRLNESVNTVNDAVLEILSSYTKIGSSKRATQEAIDQIRSLISSNHIRDFSSMFRSLYDNVDNLFPTHSSAAILVIAEAQYQDAFVVDKEINAIAMFIKLLE